MSFDKIFDLTAEVYFYFYDVVGTMKGLAVFLALVCIVPNRDDGVNKRTPYRSDLIQLCSFASHFSWSRNDVQACDATKRFERSRLVGRLPLCCR